MTGSAKPVSIDGADLEAPVWLAGGGEMGARMRAKDWSATPLGSPETWPQSVKTAVSICLNSRFPILLWLGPELRIIYNDTYIPFLGDRKHPAMLGAPGREAWGEIWGIIGPMHEEVAAGRATSVEHQLMFFARRLPRLRVGLHIVRRHAQLHVTESGRRGHDPRAWSSYASRPESSSRTPTRPHPRDRGAGCSQPR